MTSRSFMVQDTNSATPGITDVSARAFATNQVFKKIISDFDTSDLTFNLDNTVSNNVFVGVRAKFKEKFTLSNMVGGNNDIELLSESFLGRTVPISECAMGVCRAIGDLTGNECGTGDSKGNVTLWDNGC